MYNGSTPIKDIIVDTNVLVDYFMLIFEGLNRRLEPAKNEQFIRYKNLFQGKNLYIVPQNLSETFSRLRSYAKRKRTEIDYILTELIKYFQLLKEEYITKDDLLIENKFKTFGFTDIALFLLLKKGNKLLISNDYALVSYCKSKGLNARLLDEIFKF